MRVRLRRICPWTNQPYPPELDTRELRPVWDRRMTPITELLPELFEDADLKITLRQANEEARD